MAKVAEYEFSVCPVMAKKVESELFVCPVMAKEAEYELSELSVTVMETDLNSLSSLLWPLRPSIISLLLYVSMLSWWSPAPPR